MNLNSIIFSMMKVYNYSVILILIKKPEYRIVHPLLLFHSLHFPFISVGTNMLIGQWSVWGDCSPGCNGTRLRRRECLFGDCIGPFVLSQACNCGKCENLITYLMRPLL